MIKPPKISIWWLIAFAIIFFALMKQCEGKTITKTETVVKWKTDTITQTKIKEVPKTVYVEKKGRDTIIYKDKPSETTIKANQYETQIKSDSATADLQITTTGELLDVQGSITYPRIETTVETIKTRDASGFFIYGAMPITPNISPEIGGMFQIKNKVIIGLGTQYNNFTKGIDAKITLAVKL